MPLNATTGNNLPTCVTRENITPDTKQWVSTVAQDGITGRVMTYESYNASFTSNSWFYTQGLNLTAGVSYRLKFKYKNRGRSEKLRVSYGTSNSYTAMTNELFSITNEGMNTVVEKSIYFIPETTGVHYIGFQAFSNPYQHYLYIGEIIVDLAPECPEPSDINIIEVTHTSAEIEWEQYGDVDKWEVIILPNGENIPEDESELDIIEVIGDSRVIIEYLEFETEYDIYIRAVCDEETNAKSEWSPSQKITTPLPPPIYVSGAGEEYTVEELVKDILMPIKSQK